MALTSAQKLLQFVLDVIAPPSERAKAVRQLRPEDIKMTSDRESPEIGFIQAVCDYRQEKIRDIVAAGKYDGSRAATRLMGAVLARELLSVLAEARVFTEKIVITAVPMSRRKRAERGFNQSVRIAKSLVGNEHTKSGEFYNLLTKKTETAAQSHLPKSKRKKNLQNCFELSSHVDISGKVVVVIDDVTTTGATLAEARRALKAGEPEKILGLAFAH